MALESVTNVTPTNTVLAKAFTFFDNTIIINIIWAFIFLFVGLIVGKILESLLNRIFDEFEVNKSLQNTFHMQVEMSSVVATIAGKLCMILGIVLALNQLGISSIVFGSIAVIVFCIIIIIVMLGFKDFVPNLISGIFLYRKNFIKVNDKVEFEKQQGTVIYVSLLDVRIQTEENDIIHIPTSFVMKNKLKVLAKKEK